MKFQYFSNINALGIKFGLAIKKNVKVNPDPSFHPKRYIPCSKTIGLLVPEKKISKGLLPCMGMAAILVKLPLPSFL